MRSSTQIIVLQTKIEKLRFKLRQGVSEDHRKYLMKKLVKFEWQMHDLKFDPSFEKRLNRLVGDAI